MPLSDHEQRLLEQIERALYAEDPKFASTVRSTDLRHYYRRRFIRGIVVVVVGMGAIAGGVVTGYLALVALGAILAALGAAFAMTASRRMRHRDPLAKARAARKRTSHQGSFRTRMEERWQRRWDQRNL